MHCFAIWLVKILRYDISSANNKEQMVTSISLASHIIGQLVQHLTLKDEIVGSIPVLLKVTIINCSLDETLNQGPLWQC